MEICSIAGVNVENLYKMDVPRLVEKVTEMQDLVVEDCKVVKPEIVLESVDREVSEIEVVSTNSEPEMT